MTEEGFVHNIRLDKDFTTTYNKTPEDSRLSWGAKGLLWYILSREGGWKIKTWHLAKIYEGSNRGSGKSAIKVFLTELREAEYVLYCKTKGEKGRWLHNYHVYPMPYPQYQKMFPEAVKPAAVKPPPVKPPTVKRPIIPSKELDQEMSKEQQHTDSPTAPGEPTVKPVVVVPSFFSDVGGKSEVYEKLVRLYSEEQIAAAVSLMVNQGEEPTNLFGWIISCIQEGWSKAPTKDDRSEANRGVLHDKFGQLDGKQRWGVTITIGPHYIEFSPGGQCIPKVFKTDLPNFEASVRTYIGQLQERFNGH